MQIGYESDLSDVNESEELTQEEIEKERKIIEKYKPIHIPDKYREKFLAEYDCVVVNEFGDDYHYSDEEREKMNRYYHTFAELKRCKKKYRKVDEYVEVMRKFMNCLMEVAEDNGMYSPEDFVKKWLKGDIEVYGLNLPKLTGRARREISFPYLAEFILSDEPAENILPRNVDEIYLDDECKELQEEIFDKKEFEELIHGDELVEGEGVLQKFDLYDPEDEVDTSVNAAVESSSKKLKKFSKDIVYILSAMERQRRSAASLNSLVYEITGADFEDLSMYEQDTDVIVHGKMPKIKGDIMDDDVYDDYIAKLTEYERTKIQTEFSGKLRTQEEIESLILKEQLEKCGWNLRNLYDNKEKEKLLKKLQKEDEKKEKKMKKRLMAIESRKKDAKAGLSSFGSLKKLKKKKKGKGKKNKMYKKMVKQNKERIDAMIYDDAMRSIHDWD